MSVKKKSTSLGRRIAGWASNLLASGVILMAALVFGRQVTQWWHSESPRTAPNQESVVEAAPRHSDLSKSWIEFGESPLTMRRIVHQGDTVSALAELRRTCRESVSAARGSNRLPGPAETQLLKRIDQQRPVESEPGRWAIYQLEEPVPIVLAIIEEEPAARSDPKVASGARRVISWGLAFPSSIDQRIEPRQWTLFVWADERRLSGGVERLEPPIPPGSRRSMMLWSDDGGSVCGVSGQATPLEWREFYDQWHNQHGWSAVGHWQELSDSWQRRYEHPTLGKADVQFSGTAEEIMRGLWYHSPRTRN